MSGLIFRTTIEVLVAVFLIFGLFFEGRLAAVEERIFCYFKKRFFKKSVRRCGEERDCRKANDCSRYCA